MSEFKPTKTELHILMSYLGSRRSERKARSSRINGRAGGRPKGSKTKKGKGAASAK